MKILVTGGAGFVGSHVVDFYLNKGHELIIFDNLSTGKLENVNNQVNFIRGDIRSYEDLEKVFKENKFDLVVHLAAQISVKYSAIAPTEDMKTNILGTLNILELLKKYQINRFAFASSGGAIYGDTKDRPTNETHCEAPMSPYGISKLACEKYINFYIDRFKINAICFRFSNIYGERQLMDGDAGVIAIFKNKIKSKQAITIFGDGSQTRDFLYIKDALQGIDKGIASMETGVFNISSGVETSVNEIVEQIENFYNINVRKEFREKLDFEQNNSCLSFNKAEKQFGFKPKYLFNEGLHEYLKA